ncbi:MAG: hypothetical protein HQK51_11990 [Oligoflexia bacterium]|nr:hypothetical protein [Oligoflexia bacterium]
MRVKNIFTIINMYLVMIMVIIGMLFLLVPIAKVAQAQIQTQVQGESSIEIIDEEQKDLYKEALYSDAFLMAIVSYLNSNKLEGTLFLNQYKNKLGKALTLVEKKVRDEFITKLREEGVLSSSSEDTEDTIDKGNEKITDDQQKDLDNKINIKKLQYKIDFFKKNRLLPVISSYKVKHNVRDSINPKKQLLQMEVTINQDLLMPLYNGIVGIKTSKGQQKLFLACNISLQGLDWTSLGTKGEDVICEHLIKGWRKYIIDESDKFFKEEDIETMDAVRSSFYEKKIIKESLSNTNSNTNTNTLSSSGINIDEVENNANMMKLEVVIKEIKNNTILKRKSIQVDGDLTIFDLKNNVITDALDFNKKIFNSFYSNNNKENNKMVVEISGNIYRSSISALEKAVAVVKKNLTSVSVNTLILNKTLTIKNFKNYLDVFNIQNILLTKRAKASFFKTYPSLYQNGLVILKIEAKESEETLRDLILSLDGQSLNSNVTITIPDKQNIFEIQLVPKL